MKVKEVFLWSDNMVMTFGYDSQQIPDLQGEYSKELHKKIVDYSDDKTKWSGFDGKRLKMRQDVNTYFHDNQFTINKKL